MRSFLSNIQLKNANTSSNLNNWSLFQEKKAINEGEKPKKSKLEQIEKVQNVKNLKLNLKKVNEDAEKPQNNKITS